MISQKTFVAAGSDEAGRGPLAGPVVAAAAVLTKEQRKILCAEGLRDSKKLSARGRERMFDLIREIGVLWRAQAASPQKIDSINILQASLWCMRRSVEKLPFRPDVVLIDGDKLIPGLACFQKSVIGGDDLVPAISAASVIAKVLRDRVMLRLDKIFPEYGFASHKGYPSKKHREVLVNIGPSAVHRRSFRGVLP